jgi:four helix bundle protein
MIEVLNQLLIAEELGYIKDKDLQESRVRIDEILAMLDALTKSLRI